VSESERRTSESAGRASESAENRSKSIEFDSKSAKPVKITSIAYFVDQRHTFIAKLQIKALYK
jgi:hypothetical protein